MAGHFDSGLSGRWVAAPTISCWSLYVCIVQCVVCSLGVCTAFIHVYLCFTRQACECGPSRGDAVGVIVYRAQVLLC